MEKTIYSKNTPLSEIEALKGELSWSHHLINIKFIEGIKAIMPFSLFNKTLIDLGSGPNSLMGMYSLLSGCKKYIALDRKEVLEKMKIFYSLNENFLNFLYLKKIKFSNIRNISDKDIFNITLNLKKDDIVFNTRMFLMHINNTVLRKKIIKAILQSSSNALFIEPDWSSLSDDSYGFKDAMNEFFVITGINGNYGKYMFKEIEKVIEENKLCVISNNNILSLDENNIFFWKEIILLSERSIKLLMSKFNRSKEDVLVKKFSSIIEKMNNTRPPVKSPVFNCLITKTY